VQSWVCCKRSHLFGERGGPESPQVATGAFCFLGRQPTWSGLLFGLPISSDQIAVRNLAAAKWRWLPLPHQHLAPAAERLRAAQRSYFSAVRSNDSLGSGATSSERRRICAACLRQRSGSSISGEFVIVALACLWQSASPARSPRTGPELCQCMALLLIACRPENRIHTYGGSFSAIIRQSSKNAQSVLPTSP
jgi:hypothetical protein